MQYGSILLYILRLVLRLIEGPSANSSNCPVILYGEHT